MPPEEPKDLQGLFEEACRLQGSERERFLRRLREGDPDLAVQLRELLAMDEQGGPLPGDPPPSSARRAVAEAAEDADPGPDPATRAVLDKLAEHSPRASRYALQGEVARGGMGIVLEVWDEDLRRKLAMKVALGRTNPDGSTSAVDSSILSRFLEEAQVTGQLDHPGIVPVHELGMDESGAVYFTMRLVKGRSLSGVFDLARHGGEGWSEIRAIGVLLKVCEAMAYAHSKGVIHRDLKPANVMVGRFGEVYVMDWGLARALDRKDEKDIRVRHPQTTSVVHLDRRDGAAGRPDAPLCTMDGKVVGTPAYMSPEQAAGRISEMGPHSDVYAVGAMIYHLLSGQVPYVPPGAALNSYAIWYQVQKGPPDPLQRLRPDAPAELVAICEKAMARDPTQRYGDMGALGEDLRAYLERRVVGAYEAGAAAEFRKWVGRNRGLAAASAAAIVLALGGLAAVGYVQAEGRKAAEAEREIARRNEQRAEENRQRAIASEALARSERDNVLRLSAFQRLEDLQARADALWPAVPDNVPAFEAWLEEARQLVDGLRPDPATGDPGHYARLEAIRARALPLSSEALEDEVRAHPRHGELLALRAELDARRRASEVRDGRAEVASHALDLATLSADAMALNDLAWPFVDPDRAEFGREVEGLALARIAFERAGDEAQRAWIGDTLAWALLANGLDEEAVEASRLALAAAPREHRPQYERRRDRLLAEVRGAQGEAGERALAALEAEVAALEAEVSRRRTFRFTEEGDRWWHAQLTKLVAAIEAFADEETGLVQGSSPRFGWGVERRLAFAKEVRERTLTGEAVRHLWRDAIDTIAYEPECPAYEGLGIEPQLGLVPIGPDPRSGLWEFAHVQSGEVPERDASGRLVVGEETCIVLVLIPGGTFWMGAQGFDPDGPNHDPLAQGDEGPVHEVMLSPFFLSKYEMTQAQWLRSTGSNPSYYGPDWQFGDKRHDLRHPVEQVSWEECRATLLRLGLELPTEAQWESAARAGTTTPWWVGADEGGLGKAANLADAFSRTHGGAPSWLFEAWDDGYTVHAPVGTFRANAFGLHDVIGNVLEWCCDGFEGSAYARSAVIDPVHEPNDPRSRVDRGGSFKSPASHARSADRYHYLPEGSGDDLGLRPARPLVE